MITIKDVAREANVSISTVSNALNGLDIVTPETREHIKRVAERLNYTPNINGRNLKAKATNVIGLFVLSMKGPFYGELASVIYDVCFQNGYELNIIMSQAASSEAVKKNLFGKGIDGAIILNNHVSAKHADSITKAKFPVVFIDRVMCAPKVSSVVFDNYEGGRIAAKYLIDNGCKKIGYIHGFRGTNYDNTERYKGYTDILKESGLEINGNHELEGRFDEFNAYSAMKEFLKKGISLPDAFFAANDLMAIGCIKALKSEAINVPNDISIVGYDNIDISNYFTPALTTINSPADKLGYAAINSLLNMVKGGNGDITKIHCNLIIRDSCAKNKSIIKM